MEAARRGAGQGGHALEGSDKEVARRDEMVGQGPRARERERRERRGEGKRGGAHLGSRRSEATIYRIPPRAREVEEREREVAAGKEDERGRGAWGGGRQGWVGSKIHCSH
jgi:hypothetical protein